MRAQLILGLAILAASGVLANSPQSNSLASSNQGQRTGAISGVVSDASTGRPIAGAAVYLGPPASGASYKLVEVTDAKGRFVFVDLPPRSDYFISASKSGYSPGAFGPPIAGRVGGTISLAAGQWFSAANVTMARYGGISGTVVNEHGDALAGVYVRALVQVMVAGSPHLAAGVVTQTDDRGMYRLGGLKPGAYVVNVPSVQNALPASGPVPPRSQMMGRVPEVAFVSIASDVRLVVGDYPTPSFASGRPLVYAPQFSGGAQTADAATAIALGPGDERSGVDFRLEPVPGVRIAGRLDGPAEAISHQVVRLVPKGSEELGYGSETATALAAADGNFTLVNVPAGNYTIDVQRTTSEFKERLALGNIANSMTSLPWTPGFDVGLMSGGGVPSLSTIQAKGDDTCVGQASIVVGTNDVTGVIVPMRRRTRISGSIVWEGPAPAEWGTTSVLAEPARGLPSLVVRQTQAQFDGTVETFALDGLAPGEFVLHATNIRAGGVVKSIQWHDRDYLDQSFDAAPGIDLAGIMVTMTTDPPIVGGRVRNGRDAAASDMAVLAFPADRALWTGYGFTPPRIKITQVTGSGEYRFANLPAGVYDLVAIDARQATAWQDPSWLETASHVASRVVLQWGAHATQDLVVAPIK